MRRSTVLILMTLMAVLLTASGCGSGNDGPQATGPEPVTTATTATTTTTLPANPAPEDPAPAEPPPPPAPAGGAEPPPVPGDPPEPAPPPAPGGGEEPPPAPPPEAQPAPAPPPPAAQDAPSRSRTPPPPGTYVYDVTGFYRQGSDQQPAPPESTTEVSVDPDGDDFVVVSHTTIDADNSFTTTLRLSATEARLLRTETRSRQGAVPFTLVIEPEPPPPVARFPFTEGERWDFAWSDPNTGAQATGTGATLRYEEVVTGLGAVTAWVVEIRMDVTAQAFDATTVNTVWLNPETGVTVKSTSTSDSQSPFGSGYSETESVLRAGPSA